MVEDRRESVVKAVEICRDFVKKFGFDHVMHAEGRPYFEKRIKDEYDFGAFTRNNNGFNREQADFIRDFDVEFKSAISVFEIAKTYPDLARQMTAHILSLSKSKNIADKRAADLLATYFLQDDEHPVFPSRSLFLRANDEDLIINGNPVTRAENIMIVSDEGYISYDDNSFFSADYILNAEITMRNSENADDNIEVIELDNDDGSWHSWDNPDETYDTVLYPPANLESMRIALKDGAVPSMTRVVGFGKTLPNGKEIDGTKLETPLMAWIEQYNRTGGEQGRDEIALLAVQGGKYNTLPSDVRREQDDMLAEWLAADPRNMEAYRKARARQEVVNDGNIFATISNGAVLNEGENRTMALLQQFSRVSLEEEAMLNTELLNNQSRNG